MIGYEYKIIPAPTKGLKAPGVKTSEARFANALEQRINDLAGEGWEYQRSDILPSEERQGLTSSHTVYRSVLVFRRELAQEKPEESVEHPIAIDELAKDTSPVPDADDEKQTETSEQEETPEAGEKEKTPQ